MARPLNQWPHEASSTPKQGSHFPDYQTSSSHEVIPDSTYPAERRSISPRKGSTIHGFWCVREHIDECNTRIFTIPVNAITATEPTEQPDTIA
ncbi:hypothetical protein VPNG_03308 [Cytospora leucostoma]|uniref:Uncharacterized protein n=1 Tax=Cytospora leucostoma TaxID=1230097 RepID=A0A423XFL5_9PEZI|nr:hypothetical protein VPNG_03308 [Cytospora leucostoma]